MQTPDDLTESTETEADSDLTQEAILQQQINDLQKQVKKTLNFHVKIRNFQIQKKLCKIDALKFCIDRFKHNTTPLKFYTGFESFDTFKAVLDYLNPAANLLAYWGSNINTEKIVSPDFVKRGSKRIMTVE